MTDFSTAMDQAVRDTIRARVVGAWLKGAAFGGLAGAVLVTLVGR